MKRALFVLAVCLSISSMCSAVVLLNDTFADGSRIKPTCRQNRAFASSAGDVTTTARNVRLGMAGPPELHTYFTPEGSRYRWMSAKLIAGSTLSRKKVYRCHKP